MRGAAGRLPLLITVLLVVGTTHLRAPELKGLCQTDTPLMSEVRTPVPGGGKRPVQGRHVQGSDSLARFPRLPGLGDSGFPSPGSGNQRPALASAVSGLQEPPLRRVPNTSSPLEPRPLPEERPPGPIGTALRGRGGAARPGGPAQGRFRGDAGDGEGTRARGHRDGLSKEAPLPLLLLLPRPLARARPWIWALLEVRAPG